MIARRIQCFGCGGRWFSDRPANHKEGCPNLPDAPLTEEECDMAQRYDAWVRFCRNAPKTDIVLMHTLNMLTDMFERKLSHKAFVEGNRLLHRALDPEPKKPYVEPSIKTESVRRTKISTPYVVKEPK